MDEDIAFIVWAVGHDEAIAADGIEPLDRAADNNVLRCYVLLKLFHCNPPNAYAPR
jgi:hypothetical protein